MIVGYRDKATAQFASGRHVKEFSGFARQAEMRLDRLEAAMQQRRRQRGPMERLILTITGLEIKMRQYEVGEQFAVGVVDRAGLTTLNRVWESAEMMPTLDELHHPDLWIRRTG